MVKIPTFESEFKKRTGVTDAYTGFSGGEIQAASQNPSKEIGSAITKFAKFKAKVETIKDEKNASLWLSDVSSQLEIHMNDFELKYKKENQNLDAEGHTAAMIKEFKTKSDELKKLAPNKNASDRYEMMHNKYLSKIYQNATLYEATQTVEADKIKINQIYDNKAELAATKPEDIFDIIAETDALITSLDNPETEKIEGYSNHFTAAVVEKIKNKGNEKIAKNMVEGVIKRANSAEVEQVIEWLEKKKLSKYLSSEDITRYKERLSTIKEKLSGKFISDHKDELSTAEHKIITTGVYENIDQLRENHIRIHGADSVQVAEFDKDISMYNTMYQKSKHMGTLNHEEMQGFLKNLSVSTDRDKKIAQFLVTEAKHIANLIEKDPVEWAKKYRPHILAPLEMDYEAEAAGLEVDTAVLRNVNDNLIKEQIEWGIPEYNVKIWSQAESAGNAAMINNSNNGAELRAIFTLWQTKYGDHFNIGINQMIQENKLDGNWPAALMYLEDKEFEDIVNKGIKNKIDKSKFKGAEATEILEIEKDISNQMIEVRNSLMKYNNNAAEFVDSWSALVYNYALNLYQQGDDNAAENAFNRLIANKWHVLTSTIIPTTGAHSADAYDSGLKHFKENALQDMNLVSLKSGTIGQFQTEDELRNFDKINAHLNVEWRNTSDGGGVELVWDGGLEGAWPVSYTEQIPDMIAGGNPLRVYLTWDQLDEYITGLNLLDKETEEQVLGP